MCSRTASQTFSFKGITVATESISIASPDRLFVNGGWAHGAIYTADPERGYQLARRVRSGSVTVNGLIVDYKMPFGGFKQSGIGREGGIEGLENYFEVKTVYFG
jgi:hypothetical protein